MSALDKLILVSQNVQVPDDSADGVNISIVSTGTDNRSFRALAKDSASNPPAT